MSNETLATHELFAALNARLADAAARQADDSAEVRVLGAIDQTANAMLEMGAKEKDVAGLFRFKEKFAKRLIRKHKISDEELVKKEEE